MVSGRWTSAGLIDTLDPARAAHWQRNAQACPRTTAVLARVAGLQVGGFLRMAPGTRLHPHADLQDPRFLNFMLALSGGEHAWLRVGTQHHRHRDGTCIVFDPRVEHEAGNDGGVDRVTLYAAVAIHAVHLPLGGIASPSRT